MSIAQLGLAIRLGGMAVLLHLAWLLARRRRDLGAPAWLFVPLAICLSGFLAGNAPDGLFRLTGLPGAAAHLASGCAVVFLWWFCLACFDPRFRVHGAVLATGVAWFCLAGADRGLLGSATADKGLSRLLVAMGFGIVGHLVWRLLADREGDLLQNRHEARATVAVALGGQLLVDLSADLIFGFAWRPTAFAMLQNVAILCFGLWLSARLLAVRSDVLGFAGARRAPAGEARGGGRKGTDARMLHRLRTLIEVERLHLDPDMTLATFVARMQAPEREVRRLIHRELGFDHFRSFLNHHRLAEARSILADPRRSGDKLVAAAFDSGFASMASFNRVFRDAEACTPSQFRAAALAGTVPHPPGAGAAQPHVRRVLSDDRPCSEARPAA